MSMIKEYLAADHRKCDELFANMEDMANTSLQDSIEECKKFIDRTERHFQMEERVMFVEFEKKTGRKYNKVEKYLMEDAEVVIVALGTTVESAVTTAKAMREEGIKAGVVAPRVLRPFPFDDIRDAFGSSVKAIACLDRSAPGGAMGMLFNEITSALYSSGVVVPVINYIYGLGGRDMTQTHLKEIYNELKVCADAGKVVGKIQRFSGLRGPELSFFEQK